MSDKCNTLFVFEGRETEDNIVSKLEKNFMGATFAVKSVYGSDIYQLYRRLKEEYFAVDMVSLLKERSEYNRRVLAGYDNDSFAYVYFFFDYDAHATNASDEQIAEMLGFFNNETENGKLFISYPMVEAIKHFKDNETFKCLTVKCKRRNCPLLGTCLDREICLAEPHYKALVPRDSDREMAKLDSGEKWKRLIEAHLSKGNLLVHDEYQLPAVLLTQGEIFHEQMKQYISLHCPSVAVLSAFPFFVQDYFGAKKTNERLKGVM